MKIIRLESHNVKRLIAVEIAPDGALVVIGGQNAQGKSSVLDSIDYALSGKAGICDKPVRAGQKKAHVVCELDNGLTSTRTFTAAGGSHLTVTNGDGAKLSSPQAILDALYGTLAFDPLAFTRAHPKEQVDTLKRLVGLDFSGADAKRAKLYDDRHGVNTTVRTLEGQLECMSTHEGAPAKEVSVAALAAQLEEAQATNRANDEHRADVTGLDHFVKQTEERRRRVQEQIESLQAEERALATQIDKGEEDVAAATKMCAALLDVDCDPIRESLSTAEDTNREVRENAARIAVVDELARAQAESATLSEAIGAIDTEKQAALTGAAFPVEGLGFDESGVTFGGVPFDQCSSAEQLRVSVAMSLALNPKLKVALIRDGSLMDDDSLKLIAELAAEHDAQVWIERVGEGAECQVIIENGMVKTERATG